MKPILSAAELFTALETQLKLSWVAGKKGANRILKASSHTSPRPSMAGFLNLVHPNHIQVLGREELDHLDALDSRKRWETLIEIIARKPVAVILTDEVSIPNDLLENAEESNTPLWASGSTGTDVTDRLQYFLARQLALSETVHGVFMEIFSSGVLISGDSGAGKSELALELISRNHRLIADDTPEMTLVAPDVIDGSCPALLQDCLEVRGLGVLNIREMFGDNAIQTNRQLQLIIHLVMVERSQSLPAQSGDRLRGNTNTRKILGAEIPQITIPVAPGRNIAVIVEAAVRNHSLKLKGYDAAEAFLKRHQAHLAESEW